MPSAQMFEGHPRISTGSMIGEALGRGLERGITQAGDVQFQRGLIQQALEGIHNRKKNPNETPQETLVENYKALSGIPGSEKLLEQLTKQSQHQQMAELTRPFKNNGSSVANGQPPIATGMQQQGLQQGVQGQAQPFNPNQVSMGAQPNQAFQPQGPNLPHTEQDIASMNALGHHQEAGNMEAANEFAYKRYQDERDFNAKQRELDRSNAKDEAKPFMDEMHALENNIDDEALALKAIRNGIESGETGIGDKLSTLLPGQMGEALMSGKGALIQSASKNYVLGNTQVPGSKLNQMLETNMFRAATSLGKTDYGNRTTLAYMEAAHDMKRLKLNAYHELYDFYKKNGGFIPGDIGKQALARSAPLRLQVQKKLALDVQQAYEIDRGDKELLRDAQRETPVIPGTPLTPKMSKLMAKKFGDEEALKRAIKMGYTLPEQYEH